MRTMRQAFVALSMAACLVVSQREVSAAPTYQLCLTGPGDLFLNFVVQGQAVLVTGFKGITVNDLHGPVVGTLAQMPASSPAQYRMGLTVTFANGGDEAFNTVEHIVIYFDQFGLRYKSSRPDQPEPETGPVSIVACPNFG